MEILVYCNLSAKSNWPTKCRPTDELFSVWPTDMITAAGLLSFKFQSKFYFDRVPHTMHAACASGFYYYYCRYYYSDKIE